jgi:hypothetical protein
MSLPNHQYIITPRSAVTSETPPFLPITCQVTCMAPNWRHNDTSIFSTAVIHKSVCAHTVCTYRQSDCTIMCKLNIHGWSLSFATWPTSINAQGRSLIFTTWDRNINTHGWSLRFTTWATSQTHGAGTRVSNPGSTSINTQNCSLSLKPWAHKHKYSQRVPEFHNLGCRYKHKELVPEFQILGPQV